jgi:broad specificity phosphatase PhoE
MPLLVVRHARAGKRREWQGDDRLRPLDEKGRRQAAGLVGLLARFDIARITSSSHLRCTQTVEPLSEQRGLPIEERRELEEGASLDETLALLRELGDEAVLCTHGDVLENLFGEEGKKGSTRVAELRVGREPIALEYLPPPPA